MKTKTVKTLALTGLTAALAFALGASLTASAFAGS